MIGNSKTVKLALGFAAWAAGDVSMSTSAMADVRLAKIFGDHMVLQREQTVPVWGWADPGEAVTISFAGQTKTATADAAGKWTVQLDSMKANATGQDLSVKGVKSSAAAKDVLVGEVWVCGGQSNMRFPVFAAHNADEVLPKSADDQIRSFNVSMVTSSEPLTDVGGAWKASAPDTTKDFSAVGYFFAKELREKLNCPVGFINASWGGTPIKTWISLPGLQANPPIAKQLKEWDTAVEQYKKVQADPSIEAKYREDLKKWQQEVDAPFKAVIKAYNDDKAAGKPVGEKPKPPTPEPQNPNPMGMPSPSARPSTPTVSFNGMIAPLAGLGMRGVLWYQGEANGSGGLEYRTWFPRLIQDWRTHWKQEFPFLFVQIPMSGVDKTPVATSGMAWLREAQAMALTLPKTSMAVTIDIGDPNDAHPGDKTDVGHRLALLARRDVYGETLVASGPVYSSLSIEGSKARVRFKEVGTGLTPGQAPWMAKGVQPLPTDKLIGFFVAGEDRKWEEAEAVIDGDSVVLSSPAVTKPVAVRYGWASSPRCNLYNREGLPAAPFRTDDWENAKAK
jgi:sialate O-acetylesterase